MLNRRFLFFFVKKAKLYKNKNRKKVAINISMKGFVINDCDSLATIIDASIYRFVFEELVVLKKKTHFLSSRIEEYHM